MTEVASATPTNPISFKLPHPSVAKTNLEVNLSKEPESLQLLQTKLKELATGRSNISLLQLLEETYNLIRNTPPLSLNKPREKSLIPAPIVLALILYASVHGQNENHRPVATILPWLQISEKYIQLLKQKILDVQRRTAHYSQYPDLTLGPFEASTPEWREWKALTEELSTVLQKFGFKLQCNITTENYRDTTDPHAPECGTYVDKVELSLIFTLPSTPQQVKV